MKQGLDGLFRKWPELKARDLRQHLDDLPKVRKYVHDRPEGIKGESTTLAEIETLLMEHMQRAFDLMNAKCFELTERTKVG